MLQNRLKSKKYVYPLGYVLVFVVYPIVQQIFGMFIPLDERTFFLVMTIAYLSFLYLDYRECIYKKNK